MVGRSSARLSTSHMLSGSGSRTGVPVSPSVSQLLDTPSHSDKSEKSFAEAHASASADVADGASTACAMAPNGHG